MMCSFVLLDGVLVRASFSDILSGVIIRFFGQNLVQQGIQMTRIGL
jgi:hypothetical protein